jgi:cytidyltransferase-like protein
MRKRVITFGVFDGFHDGHKHFLYEASRHGDLLMVVVARDAVIERLKEQKPQFTLKERIKTLKAQGIADIIVPGDRRIGSWQIVRHKKPDIVVTGYDQHRIRESLEGVFTEEERFFKVVTIDPYEPEVYHSSILRKQ